MTDKVTTGGWFAVDSFAINLVPPSEKCRGDTCRPEGDRKIG